eukprot:15443535-Alexandrium_andersonii.AAC.1
MLCTGTRTLALNGAVGPSVVPRNSIVAGDAQANNMAKLALLDVLEQCSIAFPRVEVRQYVDDLAQKAAGCPQVILCDLSPAAVALHLQVTDMGHAISRKPRIVAPSMKL